MKKSNRGKYKRSRQKIAGLKKRAKSQQKILAWTEKYGRLPSKKSSNKLEKYMGYKLENYLAKASAVYDKAFRKLIFSKFDRKPHNKRTHNRKLRAKEVLDFVKEYRRRPSFLIPEEKQLANSYNNLTQPKSTVRSENFIKNLKKIDKCFKTNIPVKYRPTINKGLSNEKALIDIKNLDLKIRLKRHCQ